MGFLLPQWLELTWAAAFIAIAVSHLRHMAQTGGQRRAWHACHVLMAAAMAFMYLPASLSPVVIPATFWQTLLTCAGVLAAGWALVGIGRSATVIWLLTSLDLGAMLLMWSPRTIASQPALIWAVVVFLAGEATMWLLDVYRRLDGPLPGMVLQLPRIGAADSPADAALAAGTIPDLSAGSLVGQLDITTSMVVMSLGMAYMFIAMLVG